jgi:hypothetical protein
MAHEARAERRRGASTAVAAAVAAFAAVAAAGLTGCGPGYIKGTKIPNTEDNRAIIDVLRRYQRAMEARDTGGLVALCASTYHEGLGTFGGDDDYGYDKLPSRLADRFSKIRSLRYVVTVNKIEVTGGRAAVFYTYEIRYQYELDGTEHWSTETADHRMMLERADGAWKIVAGL